MLAKTTPIIACIPPSEAQAIDASLKAGASDVMFASVTTAIMLQRVRIALTLSKARAEALAYESYVTVFQQIAESAATLEDSPEGLHDILQRLCEAIGWSRAALLLLSEDPEGLLLVAANDDPLPLKVPLLRRKYPEVRAAIDSQEIVEVPDTLDSKLMGEWAQLAAERGGRALVALPLCIDDSVAGVILIRSPEPGSLKAPRAHEFLRLFAGQLAIVLKSGGLLAALHEQTKRKSLAGYQSERRTRALDQFKDFFESNSDGMMVVDANGRVLYVNRAAEQLTGYARSGLSQRPVNEIIAPAHREGLTNIIAQLVRGTNLESFDLQFLTTSGEKLTVSVASSSVLAEHGAAILAFRDVTEARALEAELRKTKDFLEHLIDSAVDGIIAADMRGQIMIFNQGASRLYGYAPEDVIGKMPVWKLYPEGAARQLMTELRAEGQGGAGRLLPTRREIVTKSGELVPVSLAASIVYEGKREVASVGIISDLRERIKMEQRLEEAQAKLQQTEKQALIAELAGTTAHELNQPLTSVMGYAELLKKKMTPDDLLYKPIDIILSEAERMAEIVRKIGRITKYETKNYVGSTQILDLDKSSPPPSSPALPTIPSTSTDSTTSRGSENG